MKSTSLSDGDAAAVSELDRYRRARVSVADAEAAHRAELLEWLVGRVSAAAPLDQVQYAAVARECDAANPDEPSLLDELFAAVEGDAFEAAA
ncbi:hypothetical protein [Streptomyces sp. MP131-18]|uniref:hypothetical protein n=1 Tax=Streptomyces sp. MP131-18 TaxID=1857892 RepID=UPI0009CD09B2|nr:hypothetical protein [Streptomyces sp. MP131-18]ONK09467.1 hypothetical protein STBA_01670 [Streptomyces sp. MP131-18]